MQAQDQYFRSGGARLRYRDEGAGPAVVLIHGWTLDLEVWNPQAAVLASTLRVIRYDRRGFGWSEGVPGLVADVDDLERLFEHFGLGAAALIGLSQGARVALAFALRHPERVTALVLDGPPDEIGDPDAMGDEDFSIAEFRDLVREEGVESFRRAWGEHALMRLYGADAAARELVARMLVRYPAKDLQGLGVPPPPPAGRAALANLRAPVLVVNGEFDTPVRRQAGESMARALPHAERVVVQGAGHLPNLDNTNAYNETIQAFLRCRSRAAA